MAPTVRNDLAVTSQEYAADRDFWIPAGARKVTFDVTAAVYVQPSEAPERGQYPEPAQPDSEIRLRPGFHSRTFPEPVYNLRLRAAGPVASVVSFAAYAAPTEGADTGDAFYPSSYSVGTGDLGAQSFTKYLYEVSTSPTFRLSSGARVQCARVENPTPHLLWIYPAAGALAYVPPWSSQSYVIGADEVSLGWPDGSAFLPWANEKVRLTLYDAYVPDAPSTWRAITEGPANGQTARFVGEGNGATPPITLLSVAGYQPIIVRECELVAATASSGGNAQGAVQLRTDVPGNPALNRVVARVSAWSPWGGGAPTVKRVRLDTPLYFDHGSMSFSLRIEGGTSGAVSTFDFDYNVTAYPAATPF